MYFPIGSCSHFLFIFARWDHSIWFLLHHHSPLPRLLSPILIHHALVVSGGWIEPCIPKDCNAKHTHINFLVSWKRIPLRTFVCVALARRSCDLKLWIETVLIRISSSLIQLVAPPAIVQVIPILLRGNA